jgi:hypothetical protein
MSDDFDWVNNPDIAVREQRAIAVYENTRGGLVILQERSWDEEDDTCIVIAQTSIDAFIAALLKAAGRDEQRRAMTPAERKRKQRSKGRDTVTPGATPNVTSVTNVTPNVTENVTSRDRVVTTAAFGHRRETVGGAA